ncbi:hypothetical protein NL676_027619 [Syzygium grande]|nr:hypothetical protein NL676_027619 [Syzygium grande]
MSSSSPSRRAEVPVFTVTGIGTRIAVSVAPTITASDLKRVLERAHFSCFPEIGEIRVDGVMVERRAFSCLITFREWTDMEPRDLTAVNLYYHSFKGIFVVQRKRREISIDGKVAPKKIELM